MRVTSLILALMIGTSLVFGHTTYTGYSGAPGRQTCASSCHGSGTGTITVSGFPTSYSPGQAYTVTVSRTGMTNIANFNASVRVGTSTTNGGVISAGTATSVYNASGETNGLHFTSGPQATGTFVWTAPAAGTGAVRLYLAGHQGTVDGPDNSFVLTAVELAAPTAPQELVILPDSTLVRLNWRRSAVAAGYAIYRDATTDVAPLPVNLIGIATDTFFVDSFAIGRPDLKAFYTITATTP